MPPSRYHLSGTQYLKPKRSFRVSTRLLSRVQSGESGWNQRTPTELRINTRRVAHPSFWEGWGLGSCSGALVGWRELISFETPQRRESPTLRNPKGGPPA